MLYNMSLLRFQKTSSVRENLSFHAKTPDYGKDEIFVPCHKKKCHKKNIEDLLTETQKEKITS